jgi:alpha-L-fucosidase
MVGQHGDYYSSEYQDLEGVGAEHPWEESRGMGRSYGYNRAENIDHYRTSRELIHELIDVVSRGGNLLLNVGPTADGRIPVIMQQRLRDIGSWLRINGESIYGTRAWKPTGQPAGGPAGEELSNLRFTRKGPDLYAHVLEWPEGEIRIPGLGSPGGPGWEPEPDRPEGVSVELLGFEGPIEWRVEGRSIIIDPPVMSPSQVPSPYAYVFKIGSALVPSPHLPSA